MNGEYKSSSQNMINASPLEVTAWKSSGNEVQLNLDSLLQLGKKAPKYMRIKCTFSPPLVKDSPLITDSLSGQLIL